ncbi:MULTISPECIES: hypothetical protein [unclassified Marinobacter]|nr:hypothetical protein [Marinobacter sp. DSM 26671]
MSSPAEMKQKERHHNEQMAAQKGSSRIAKLALAVAILSLIVSVALHFLD